MSFKTQLKKINEDAKRREAENQEMQQKLDGINEFFDNLPEEFFDGYEDDSEETNSQTSRKIQKIESADILEMNGNVIKSNVPPQEILSTIIKLSNENKNFKLKYNWVK